jgi:hypothetical protein
MLRVEVGARALHNPGTEASQPQRATREKSKNAYMYMILPELKILED